MKEAGDRMQQQNLTVITMLNKYRQSSKIQTEQELWHSEVYHRLMAIGELKGSHTAICYAFPRAPAVISVFFIFFFFFFQLQGST